MKLAIVGAGWSGLAAAVRAREAGHEVALFEMARRPGGRARAVDAKGDDLGLKDGDGGVDNGQHILIGAYTRTLDLMRTVGAEPGELLHRLPLDLRYPDGRGLRLPAGPAWLGFGWAVLRCRGWSMGDRLSLLRAAAGWAGAGFRCAPDLTVSSLCARVTPAVQRTLIEPLCVAALNTPAASASAVVFLRVLKDALFSGAGSADLMLPRRSLTALLPAPAMAWLQRAGASVRLGMRVRHLVRAGEGWQVDGELFDGVVIACSAAEAARLADPISPAWAERARALTYEPIITVYLHCPGARLPSPITALVEGPDAPAQFAFDHGAIGGTPDAFAFVVSGAAAWVEAGAEATSSAVLRQAQAAFPRGTWPALPTIHRALIERRATFRCIPGLDRPPALIDHRLAAAGDYIEGPYPATLEGAVRSGESAFRHATA